MRAIVTLAIKDLRLLTRDKFGMFWVVVFPLLMALMFGAIFGGSGGGRARSLKIAYVGSGDSTSVEGFYDQLKSAKVLDVRRMSLDSARYQVARSKLTAYVLYTDTTSGGFAIFGGEKPSIEVGIDPARKAERGYLKGLVTQAYFTHLQRRMMDLSAMRLSIGDQRAAVKQDTSMPEDYKQYLLGMMDNLDGFLGSVVATDSVAAQMGTESAGRTRSEDFSPFGNPDVEFVDVSVQKTGPKSSFEITFPQSLQWALIGVAATFAMTIVTERVRGTFLRLRLAPISRTHILAGKGLACFLACFIDCAILMTIGVLLFDVSVSSVGMLALALGSAAFCFVGIMMLISVLGKTEQSVAGAGWAILLVMSMTGGGMVPVLAMPGWMQTIGSFSPVKWSVLAIEGAVWRGYALSDMMLPVGVLMGVGLVGFIIGSTILSKSDG